MIKLKLLAEKALIVIFWVSLIFLFLTFPTFKNLFLTDNSINVLAWPDMIDIKAVAKFQEKTGIKVNLNYYENNEELFSKLDVTKGKGYDLITITDVGVEDLVKKDLLKKLDKSKLAFLDKLDSHFVGKYFDPSNDYSVPYNWDVYGLGVDLNYFKGKVEESWKLIFDPKYAPNKITMVDEPFDAVLLASLYLYGDTESIKDDNKLKEIKKVLCKQKCWVEAYDTLRGDYFLRSGICPVVVFQSAFYSRIEDDKDLRFIIPKEGAFLVIDSLVIPKVSDKEEKVYKFINFLFEEENIRDLFDRFGYLPTMHDILYSLDLKNIGGLDYILSSERFDKYFFFKRLIDRNKVSELWIDLRAS